MFYSAVLIQAGNLTRMSKFPLELFMLCWDLDEKTGRVWIGQVSSRQITPSEQCWVHFFVDCDREWYLTRSWIPRVSFFDRWWLRIQDPYDICRESFSQSQPWFWRTLDGAFVHHHQVLIMGKAELTHPSYSGFRSLRWSELPEQTGRAPLVLNASIGTLYMFKIVNSNDNSFLNPKIM